MGTDDAFNNDYHVMKAKTSEDSTCEHESNCDSVSYSCSSASSLQLLDSEIFELEDESVAENENDYLTELEKIRKMIEDSAIFTHNDSALPGIHRSDPRTCIRDKFSSTLHAEADNQDQDAPTALKGVEQFHQTDENSARGWRELEKAVDCIDSFVRAHNQKLSPPAFAKNFDKCANVGEGLNLSRLKIRVKEWKSIVQHWRNEDVNDERDRREESDTNEMRTHDAELKEIYERLKSYELEVNHSKMTIEDLLSKLHIYEGKDHKKSGLEILKEQTGSPIDHLEALHDSNGDGISEIKTIASTQQYFENTLEDMRQQVANERMQILYEREKQQLDYDARSNELEEVHALSLQLLRSLLLREKLLKREEKAPRGSSPKRFPTCDISRISK
uniref:AlNc14C57G4310 protein n=1 Tax=Albugo laibachii Nc14 TaxID=890382 RepID=F0WCD0_9STRA|nr:AlNc14C57G4310 [Albugo laibachii Nc14]|eukprot:CCA18845.1 AlNc14C57G4310 [Albugo laibachii Nc14]